MYLASLTITNFRHFTKTTVSFQPGLNVIVGPNNIRKSAVVDGLHALLAGADDPYPRFTSDDVHLPNGGTATGEITFTFVFKDLDTDDEADFLHALRESPAGEIEAVMGVTYGEPDILWLRFPGCRAGTAAGSLRAEALTDILAAADVINSYLHSELSILLSQFGR
ncbi:AAA family ATPase [Pararhizobium sp. A13]|uniref:AAA family ATPase n=1 Tax=Pararhizobium sp. A13 TaxID=3133975 RepID=UPI0032498E52